MLSMAGVELEPADLAALLRHTEGWPAALYLAALSIRNGRDPHAAVAGFAGDDRLMADYLRDEILTPAPCARRRVPAPHLGPRAALGHRPATRCSTERARERCSGRSRARASRSCRSTTPTTSTATTRSSPRCSRRSSAGAIRCGPRDLHRRAGAWLEREGSIDDALGHALAAGDVADAGSRLWTIAPSRIAHGRVDEIRAWLDRLRPEQISSHASLALAAASTHLVDGDRDRLEHWLDTAERLIAAGREIEPSPAAACAVLRAVLARGGTSAMVDDAAIAYELAAEDDPWRPLACMLRGAGLHLLGDRGARRARAGGGRAPRRRRRPERPGALPRPARADPRRRRGLGGGGAARIARPRPARASRRLALPELGARVRGVGARPGPSRPCRRGPGRPPAGAASCSGASWTRRRGTPSRRAWPSPGRCCASVTPPARARCSSQARADAARGGRRAARGALGRGRPAPGGRVRDVRARRAPRR